MKRTELIATLVANTEKVKEYIVDNILWENPIDSLDEHPCKDLEYGLKTLAAEGYAMYGALYCILSLHRNIFLESVACEIYVSSVEVQEQYARLVDELFSDLDDYEYYKFAMLASVFRALKDAD